MSERAAEDRPPVRLEREADTGVAIIAIDRPEQRNAMSEELLRAFSAAVDSVRADAGVRALVVTGAGRYFCAGADLGSVGDAVRGEGAGQPARLRDALLAIYRPFLSLLELDVPTIAAINGAAVGGGLGLALACELRIASTEAKLAAPFAKIGIHPGMGISHLLPRIVGLQNALDMLYTGRQVRGEEAARMGLVLRAVAPEKVMDEALALARECAAGAPLVTRAVKETVSRPAISATDLRLAIEAEAAGQALLWDSEDWAEGVQAFLEKRPPRFKGR